MAQAQAHSGADLPGPTPWTTAWRRSGKAQIWRICHRRAVRWHGRPFQAPPANASIAPNWKLEQNQMVRRSKNEGGGANCNTIAGSARDTEKPPYKLTVREKEALAKFEAASETRGPRS
jgi:hypothetical protein